MGSIPAGAIPAGGRVEDGSFLPVVAHSCPCPRAGFLFLPVPFLPVPERLRILWFLHPYNMGGLRLHGANFVSRMTMPRSYTRKKVEGSVYATPIILRVGMTRS